VEENTNSFSRGGKYKLYFLNNHNESVPYKAKKYVVSNSIFIRRVFQISKIAVKNILCNFGH
jgi:hypothetical protein